MITTDDANVWLCIRCLMPRPTEFNVYCDECLRYLDGRLYEAIYGSAPYWDGAFDYED